MEDGEILAATVGDPLKVRPELRSREIGDRAGDVQQAK
jgi:hypothetical protein